VDFSTSHQLYLSLLAKWNRTINLTALPIDPPTPEAVDRLLVEPIQASRYAGQPARIIDLGSGGGSPAIPLWIELPGAHLTMVESRTRKCAFLNECVRQIAPGKGEAVALRFEELLSVRPDLAGSADLVTVRAVTLDQPLVELISKLGKSGCRLFRFTSLTEVESERVRGEVHAGIDLLETHPLVESSGSILQIFGCSTWNIPE
jgi:16S rRNA (guanine527-N7)-methyltransferase